MISPERMEQLGATGVPEDQRPKAQVTGENGNAYNLIAIVQTTLKDADMRDKSDELGQVYYSCESYEELLQLLAEYANLA